LIEAFRSRGYTCSTEAGRAIIQDQVRINGTALPWHNRLLFAELMLQWEMRSYHLAEQSSGPVFLDRGVPDVLGYLRLIGLPAPHHVQKAATEFRYHRRVFIAPPWKEIFQQDVERKQDFKEAERTYGALFATYKDLGYELVEVPRVGVESRVKYILNHLALER
jgi:predicted ATPase